VPKVRSRSAKSTNTTLQKEAAKRLSEGPGNELPHGPDPLVHELQVHQVELEMQNEALRAAQLEIEESRAKYVDLYDLAPVGYLSFSDKGLISEVNLTAAQLLGVERKWLINKPFSLFLEPKSQDAFYHHRQEVLDSSAKQTCELILRRRNKTLVNIQLDSIDVHGNGYSSVRSILTDTTERERAREALRVSEQRHRSYIEVTGALGWTTNVKGEVVEDLPSWRKYTGQSEEEIMGGGWANALHSDDIEHTLQAWNSAVTNNAPYEVEYRMRRHDGIYRLFLVRGVPVLKADGSIGEWVGTCIDITERKAAEERLQKSEEWLRQFFESIPDYCYLVSPKGKIIDANRAAIETLGYRLDEVVGRPVETIYAPKSQKKRVQLFERWLETGMLRNEEMTIRTKEGRERTVLLSAGTMKDREGKIIHSTSIQTDITERKKIERSLRESEERFRLFFEQSNAVMLLIEPDSGAIMDVNPAAARFYGYPRERMSSMNIGNINALPSDEVLSERRRVIEGERNYFVFPHRLANDEIRTVEVYFNPITTKEGRKLLFSICHDITERMKLEEKQKRLEVQIRQTQKMEAIGTLAGGIAHDFNNILGAIIGFAEMIGEDAIPGSSEQKRIELVEKAAFRGRDLVKQILTFSRQTSRDKEPLVLREVIEEVLKLLRSVLPSTIAIDTRMSTAESVILADSVQMHQVLMNLCTNAAHAMREKGGLMEISLEDVYFTPGTPVPDPRMKSIGYLKLSVRDTGYGMEEETLKQIFDPFFTTKAPGEGTGLGLSVVHGIVSDHDGCILVDSAPGKGSTFHIYLPKLKEHGVPEVKGPIVTPRGSERILLVDDENMMVVLNEERLRGLGYKVVASTSSRKALDIFRRRPDRFDLVITDYTMPDLTGIDLAGELLNMRPDIPVILYTGQSETGLPERVKKAGIVELLMKPLTKQDLAQAVRRALDEKNSAKLPFGSISHSTEK
jgi:PAS domain S-box-containing protein